MIQLKPGIPPASLNKPTHSAARRKNRTEKKKSGGLRFKRVFSDPAVAPFDQIEWERRTAEITDDSGKVIFKQEDIEVPKNWSALATKIAVSKYFYGDIANGSDPAPIAATIVTADGLLGSCMLPCHVKPSSTLGGQMTAAAAILDQYNNGLLTPNCTP